MRHTPYTYRRVDGISKQLLRWTTTRNWVHEAEIQVRDWDRAGFEPKTIT